MKWDKKITEYLSKRDIVVRAENASTMEQEDFKEIRFDGFGASDSGHIMGIHPFAPGTPQGLLEDKINRVYDETIGKKAIVRMGSDLEDLIIKKTSEVIERFIFKPSHMYGKENGLNTNFDGVIILDDMLARNTIIPAEIKTISFYGGKYYDFDKAVLIEGPEGSEEDTWKSLLTKKVEIEYAPDDYMPERRPIERHILYNAELAGIPPYYYTQVQQQIDFLDSTYGYLFAMDIKNWTLYGFKIPRDKHCIKGLNSRAGKLIVKLKEARKNE